MINKINNIHDLRQEKERLRIKKQLVQEQIREDIALIKKEMNPLHVIKTEVQNIKEAHASPLTNKIGGGVLKFAVDMFIKNILFRKSSFIKKAIITGIVHKALPTLDKNPGSIFKKITRLVTNVNNN